MPTPLADPSDRALLRPPQSILARSEPRPHLPVLTALMLALLLVLLDTHVPGHAASVRALAVLGVLLLAGIVFFPTLELEPRVRAPVLAALAVPILLSPLLITSSVLARMLLTMAAGLFAMKLYDVHVGAALGRIPSVRSYLGYLPNFYVLVQRRASREHGPGRRETLLSLGLALLGLGVAYAALQFVFGLAWHERPFLVEHGLKVPVFMAAVFLAMAVPVHLLRLASCPAREFTAVPFLARTPADFWRRYNRVVQQFLFENVFKRTGGFRSPRRAILVAFLVSGLLHEYLLALTLLRIEGYQMLFFLLQGAAVAATAGLKPKGKAAVPAVVLTWAFLILSSVLFFASFDRVLGFYAGEVP